MNKVLVFRFWVSFGSVLGRLWISVLGVGFGVLGHLLIMVYRRAIGRGGRRQITPAQRLYRRSRRVGPRARVTRRQLLYRILSRARVPLAVIRATLRLLPRSRALRRRS